MEVNDLIETESRQTGSKGFARRLRAAGRIPAIVYGPGTDGEKPISVDPKIFDLQRKQYGKQHLFQLNIDGGTQMRVQLKDVSRDPIKRTYTHIDFYAVDKNKAIAIEVPIELTGKPKGVVNGGILTQLKRRIEVSVLPDAVPEKLTADVTHLDTGEILHVSELAFPEGVSPNAGDTEAVARIAAPSGKAAKKEGEEAEGEAAAAG
ncbi:MAG: 50S ribosomal protein L25 [Myxococcota bacterium]